MSSCPQLTLCDTYPGDICHQGTSSYMQWLCHPGSSYLLDNARKPSRPLPNQQGKFPSAARHFHKLSCMEWPFLLSRMSPLDTRCMNLYRSSIQQDIHQSNTCRLRTLPCRESPHQFRCSGRLGLDRTSSHPRSCLASTCLSTRGQLHKSSCTHA